MRVRVAKRDPAVTIPGARHKFRPSRASRYRSGAIGSNMALRATATARSRATTRLPSTRSGHSVDMAIIPIGKAKCRQNDNLKRRRKQPMPNYSTLILAALMIGHHFSASAL
jgi:hypothetical protein